MIGILGSGYWDKNLVRVFHEMSVLTALCDKNEDTLTAFREQYPEVRTCMAVSDLLADESMRAEPLRRECERFLQCIETGQRPLTDGREGLRVLRVLNVCQRSPDQNGRKMSLTKRSEDSEHPAYFKHETAFVENDAFIGAGAVVTKNVPEHALMAGNPARRIGWVCECGEKLNRELACPRCDLKYTEVTTGLARAVSNM